MLEGDYVRLEPLSRDHLPGLLEVGLDPSLWAWTVTKVRSTDDLRRHVETALEEQARGESPPLATNWKATGQPIGEHALRKYRA